MLAVAAYLLVVNVLAAFAFVYDKRQSRMNMRRISHRTLLTLSAAGGSVGAFFASQLVGHKTRNITFQNAFRRVVAVQTGALLLFYVWPEPLARASEVVIG